MKRKRKKKNLADDDDWAVEELTMMREMKLKAYLFDPLVAFSDVGGCFPS